MGKSTTDNSEATVAYTGRLLAAAQMRNTPINSEGHMALALCMTVLLDEPAGAVLQLEQCFGKQGHLQCQAAARRYRAGTRVTVTAPVFALKINARFVEHIHVHQVDQSATNVSMEQGNANRHHHAI